MPGNLPRGAMGKPPTQLIEHVVEGPPLLFVACRHPPNVACGIDVALGFRDGDRLPMVVNPAVDEAPALNEQTREVVGLELIRRIGHRGGRVGVTGGPVYGRRGQRRSLTDIGRLGADRSEVRPTAVTSAAGPACNTRAAATLVGQTGHVHQAPIPRGST